MSKPSWLQRLSHSSQKITQGVTDIFIKRKLDDAALEELEDLLITADLGPATAATLVKKLAQDRFGKDITPEEVKETLAGFITEMLQPAVKPLQIPEDKSPFVLLMVGVNGTGKTTTIGKLSKQFRTKGKSVLLAAGDTFRAAATEQLILWGEKTGCDVYHKNSGADPAALAFEALEKATASQTDILMIDTAGRLHNKTHLMEELQKIIRVLKKQRPDTPHEIILTLDATTGQNAYAQVETFQSMVNISGLIVTKLDGSAKGGVLVGLVEKFKLPVYAIGLGEGEDDLQGFEAEHYAKSLLGIE